MEIYDLKAQLIFNLMPKTLPTTSAFPSEVFNLDRTALEECYLEIRKNYSSLMRSRGAFKGQARKSQEAMKVLEQKLRLIAEREASVRAEAYEMLEIVTGVIGELEDCLLYTSPSPRD